MAARERLLDALAQLRGSVEARLPAAHDHEQRSVAPGPGPGRLGIELWLKLEEHALLPALRHAASVHQPVVVNVGHDGDVLRDLMADPAGTPGLVENAARRHLHHTEQLLRDPEWTERLDWAALEQDVAQWLQRWREEIAEHGDIEDEECDPVGLPPR